MSDLITDIAMFELSIEVIFLIVMFILLAVLSLIPDEKWVKFTKSNWFDNFLHPKH